EQACVEKRIDPQIVLKELATADAQKAADETDCAKLTMTQLVDSIERTHHAYLKEELPRLDLITEKIARVHAATHPEMVQLRTIFINFKAELEAHMAKEEQILFPLCRN